VTVYGRQQGGSDYMIMGASTAARPYISVIVPAYDSARSISRCMHALERQRTRHPFEVIVVDSGNDNTSDLARRALPQVRALRLPERATPPLARNAGAEAARGDVLAFIDSDAYADESWVDNVAAAAATGYDLICGSIENANPLSAVARAEELLQFNEFLPDLPGGPRWFAFSANMIMLKAAFRRFGPFVDMRAAEDVVFSRKLIAEGGRVLFYPSLRVQHDNRTQLQPYLRNQFLLGKHTAIARRIVRFADTDSYWLFLVMLPLGPVAKLAKISLRFLRQRPRRILSLVREFPVVSLGACVYSLGMLAGVAHSIPSNLKWARRRAGTA
jgi:glycosyltransferase involved in cell wall biosynthesis